jgi:ABC-type uncharacterized transport system permease subunit
VADNTVLNTGTGGDTVRDKDRAGVKTQIVGVDIDIGSASEKLLTSGQKTMANSIPVVLASDQSTLAAPADPFGTTADAVVAAGAAGSISAKLRRISQGVEDLKTGVVLPAGTNNIGDVDVLTLPADPLGANADALVAAGAAGSISAKLRRISQSIEDLKTGIVLPAGTNNIGDVDVLTLPADPFGANADAVVAAGAAGSMSAKLRRISQSVEDLKTSVVLAAGSAAIGKLAANSGVDIGDVTVDNAAGTNPLPTQGNVAHDGAAAGNPILNGAQYKASPAKVSADGDVCTVAVTQEGKLLLPPWTSAADTTNVNNSYASAQTNTSQVSAPGANKRLVIVELCYSRDTAGNAKLVEDPAGTPANKFGPHYFPANGGMVSTQCYVPLTTNKALGFTSVGGGNETLTMRVIVENV